jgi:hypothetical protein
MIETRTINLAEVIQKEYPKVNNNWSMKRKVAHRKFISAKMKRHQSTILSVLKDVVHESIRSKHPSHSN